MADANDGRVTLVYEPGYGDDPDCFFRVEDKIHDPANDDIYIARPRADDDAREERIEKLRDVGFAMYAAHGDMTRDRDEWKARAERAEAERDEARKALAVEPDALVNAIMGSDLVRLYGIKNIEVARYHARQIARVYRALAAECAERAAKGVASAPATERERAEAAYGAHDLACQDDREAFVAGWEARARAGPA